MAASGSQGTQPSDAGTDLDTVRRIVLSGLGGLSARAFLFGSRVRGDHRAASDIDVAILPLEPLPTGVMASIREALEDSGVPFFVDLLDLSEAPSGLRDRVLKEGVEWTASAIG